MVGKLVAVVTFAVLPVLRAAGPALAASGGFGPPTPETPSGEAISQLYWIVFAVCAVVFVLVESALILFIIRFRRRRGTPESAEGPQIHGNTRLEIIWTIIPAVVLAALAVFTFTRIPAVQARDVKSADALRVHVDGHQFYWQYVYPNGAISLDDLYLPVGQPVELELNATDVIHSWWVPSLTGKLDAIPGRHNTLRFIPQATGTFEGKCAELCGVQHAVMLTTVHVLPREEYQAWVEETAAAQQNGGGLGKETWNAVCAKCHGLDGTGDVGPAIAGNGTLANFDSLDTLVRKRGQNTPQFPSYMPAVGSGWSDAQLNALIDYIKSQKQLSTAPPVNQGGGG
jgi:cytochrome c oxidase subunit II